MASGLKANITKQLLDRNVPNFSIKPVKVWCLLKLISQLKSLCFFFFLKLSFANLLISYFIRFNKDCLFVYRFSSKFLPISFSNCDFINGVYHIDSLFLIYYSDASAITTQILTQEVALWGYSIFRCAGVQC